MAAGVVALRSGGLTTHNHHPPVAWGSKPRRELLIAPSTISLLLLLTAFAGPDLHAQIRQARADGLSRKVALQRLPPRPVEPCQLAPLKTALPDFTILRVAALEASGIVVLDRMGGGNEEPAEKAIAKFLAENKEWVSVPILRDGEVEKIPTNELTIIFQPGVTPAQAGELFSANKLEVLERPKGASPGPYVTRRPGGSAKEVVELAESLGKLPAVKSAKPVYVSFFKPR